MDSQGTWHPPIETFHKTLEIERQQTGDKPRGGTWSGEGTEATLRRKGGGAESMGCGEKAFGV